MISNNSPGPADIDFAMQAFSVWDPAGTGNMQKIDLASVLRFSGVFPSDTQVEEIMGSLTAAHLIKLSDFINIRSDCQRDPSFVPTSSVTLTRCFRAFDTQNEGRLRVSEIQQLGLKQISEFCEGEYFIYPKYVRSMNRLIR
jgi:Ca2+-binding EF-hand superfamily protein